MVDSIMVVGALTLALCDRCDLKATQTNVQHCLIQELMFYEFECHGSNQKHLLCKR